MVLDNPGGEVNENTYTIGFWTENRTPTPAERNWNKSQTKANDSGVVQSVNFIENETGYDFFSYIDDQIEEKIEDNTLIFNDGIIDSNFTPTNTPNLNG